MIKLMDWHGKKKEIPPIRTGLPEIPYDAVLYSLNWGQSASNEYECFAFDVTHSENRLSLSGWYIDPESERRITAEDVLTNNVAVSGNALRKAVTGRPP